ncbi:MAG: efflux RND transporter periplasmic adaptor subunit [Desulfarculaceae bacterium]
MKQRLCLVGSAFFLLCASLTVYAQPPGKFAVRVFRVGSGPKAAEMVGLGSVRCLKSLKLGFAETGVLTELKVEEGDSVRKGQVLARLDDRVLRADIKAQEAEVEAARLKVGHLTEKQSSQEKLFQGRAIALNELKETTHQLEQARSALKLAQARLAGLRAKLKTKELRSPVDGVVTKRDSETGEVVGPSVEMLEIMSCAKVLAEVRFGEKLYLRVLKDMPVVIMADALPGREFMGRVYSKSPVVDDKERTFVVKVSLDNPKLTLRPGMFVRATLLPVKAGDSLWIPQQAILAQADGKAVVEIAGSGRLTKRKITLGKKVGQGVEVVSGLKPGELVTLKAPAPGAPTSQPAGGKRP